VAWVGVFLLATGGCGKRDEAAPEQKTQTASEGGAEPVPGAQMPPDKVAVARERSQANLKRLGAAFHNYASVFHYLPIGLIDFKTGKLGLSWRVQILLHLNDPEAEALWKRFKLNEPWDSEHNRRLIREMPRVYAPVRGSAPEGHTFYQGFADHCLGPGGKELPEQAPVISYGRAAFFRDPRTDFGPVPKGYSPDFGLPARGRRFTEIVDGTSNTILLAEAGRAVPWTKPEDIPFRHQMEKLGAGGTWPKLGGLFDGDFHVVMVDGLVYSVKGSVPADKLRPFITFADGLVPDYAAVGIEPPWLKEPKKDVPPAKSVK
jgi:hypothetical protein